MGGRSLKFKSNRLKKEVDKTKKGKRKITGNSNPNDFYRGTRTASRGGGGGGGETVTLRDGTQITFAKGTTNKDIKRVFGGNFNRDSVAKMFGISSQAGKEPTKAVLSLSGNSIKASITHPNYTANFRLEKQSNGKTVFHGDFIRARGGDNALGAGVRGITSGIKFGYEKLGLSAVKVGTAAGRAGSREWQGSLIWARMGLDAPLSRVFPRGLPSALPASVRGAKTVSDIVSTKEGKAWWAQNRVSYSGTLNLRGNKNSSSWKLASKFLKLRG